MIESFCSYLHVNKDLYTEHGPIKIAILGDSVSHGYLADGKMSHETVYHNRLRQMLNEKYTYFPISVLNFSLGGCTAGYALSKFESFVVPHSPDLVIICFGLNDVNHSVERFEAELGGIFDKCIEHGYPAVFLTPNMLCTRQLEDPNHKYWNYSGKVAEFQNSGKMDRFMDKARELAAARGIPVADAYAVWKDMAAKGVDTTSLLANRINHPSVEMHKLFADLLYEVIVGEPYDGEAATNSSDGMIGNR